MALFLFSAVILTAAAFPAAAETTHWKSNVGGELEFVEQNGEARLAYSKLPMADIAASRNIEIGQVIFKGRGGPGEYTGSFFFHQLRGCPPQATDAAISRRGAVLVLNGFLPADRGLQPCKVGTMQQTWEFASADPASQPAPLSDMDECRRLSRSVLVDCLDGKFDACTESLRSTDFYSSPICKRAIQDKYDALVKFQPKAPTPVAIAAATPPTARVPAPNILAWSLVLLGFLTGFFPAIGQNAPEKPPLAQSIVFGVLFLFAGGLYGGFAMSWAPYHWWVAAPAYIYALFWSYWTVRGMYFFYHYYFTKHPIAPIVEPPLRTGKPIDMPAAGEALMPDIKNFQNPPPRFASELHRERAKAYEEAVAADGKLADAILQREIARKKLSKWFKSGKDKG